ncbi:Arf family GTPase ARL3 [Ascoidea rubescens DSM 1968]|uniref:ARF/SAR superfamily n=1 Tax=Ascoidea rubescens DSM 1968 TaxID=1344418 RepID=A0A1D2VSH2_9ASCO|nr:ARF/SAR superfamily [Ascoidea rubescens DSM 1968]ODV64563.1 ARF/SAR superfamily [Ascoidea rubescens DSM 1968]
MFHLFRGLYDSYNKKKEYSILILGLDNAGKTTFLEKLKEIYSKINKEKVKIIPNERILPTVGQNVGYIKASKDTILKFWDVGGQTELRSMWANYFELAHGIIFVVDSCDRDRIEECQRELLKILDPDESQFQSVGETDHYIDKSIPILMLANKQDRPEHLEVEDIKEIFNRIAEHLGARDSRVLPISALTGDGVQDAADWLLIRLARNKSNRPPKYK